MKYSRKNLFLSNMESLERKLYFVNENILDQAGLQKLFCRGALKCQMPLGVCEKLFGVGAQSLNVSVIFFHNFS